MTAGFGTLRDDDIGAAIHSLAGHCRRSNLANDENARLTDVRACVTERKWVDYMSPRPGQTQPSQKWTYVKAVTIDGVPGLAGSGFYPW